MHELQYIKTGRILPHPDNPRKQIGDVRELADSIKANGVLQNLTVVPYYSNQHGRVMDGIYTVIIGHRRLAAAKLAGLETVPCVVADMDYKTQLATMLTENMQRSDLTVYEQAQTFKQLSMDLGMSVGEIADMSGFSETTVRRRTKLAEYDAQKFKKACERGATLMDFAELDKLEDPKVRAECLEVIGTANFQNRLRTALDAQKHKARRARWLEQLPEWATQIEQQGYVDMVPTPMNYFRNYGNWTRADDVEKPADADEVRYFYRVSEGQIDIYKEARETEKSPEELERERVREQRTKNWEQLIAISRRHHQLRTQFVRELNVTRDMQPVVMRNAADAMLFEGGRSVYGGGKNWEALAKLAELPYDSRDDSELRCGFQRIRSQWPERTLLLTAYWMMESDGQSYIRREWRDGAYINLYKNNQTLDRIYYMLEELGYACSDEEYRMRRGTHELFDTEEDDEC